MAVALSDSYAYCEQLARHEAGNFYHAFKLLPAAQRRGMCALYSFLRVSDDLADAPGHENAKAVTLRAWRGAFERALSGHYSHALHAAFHDTVCRYAIPRQYLEDVLDGVEMDLVNHSYATFPDLYDYCYRVASAVGLACIHIWGFSDGRAKPLAERAGIAFQLTNILRDLREDSARGRVYLPQEDLRQFDYTLEQLRACERNDHFRELMRFEVQRARQYYACARPLSGLLSRPGRAVFQVMLGTYQSLLDVIEARDYDVFAGRATLSRWRKFSLAARAIPIRWGWAMRRGDG
jgi:phytoene synthase